jgi:hypothetical protein
MLLALFAAPFQHVHSAAEHDHDAGHDDSSVVHIHFLSIPEPQDQSGGTSFDHPDHDHASRPLDSFATLAQAAHTLWFVLQSFVGPEIPAKSFVGVVITDACGHDPPALNRSLSRGPPA